MQTANRFIIVINTNCEICNGVVNDAIEVSGANIVETILQGNVTVKGIHITVHSNQYLVACRHCWEIIRNG